jgi:hypothetical protein
MPDQYRVTIRLEAALYAQLAARGRQGQPLAAVVRAALVDYLSRQPETPQDAATLRETVAAIAARLDRLEAQVDALAADRQPPTARTDTPRLPEAATADTGTPRRPGRPSTPLRQQILDVLRAHPEGLSAEALRVYVHAQRPIGDMLAGMRKGGVIRALGPRTQRRYVLAEGN